MKRFTERLTHPIGRGYQKMQEDNQVLPVYLFIFFGNFLGWILKAVYILETTGALGLGPLGLWTVPIQAIFSATIAVVIITTSWRKLLKIPKPLRYFAAVTAGLTTKFTIEVVLGLNHFAQQIF